MEEINVYITERKGRLYLCWKIGKQVKYQSCRTEDPVEAEILRRKHQDKLRLGEIDPYAVHRDRLLKDHAQDHYEYIRASGTTEKRANAVRTRVIRILDESGMKFIQDISPTKVKMAIAEMLRVPQKRGVPRENRVRISAQTRNFYLGAFKQFIRWMQIDRRISDNPLLGLKGENVQLDRRHERRAFSDAEFAKLVKAAAASTQVIEGLTGAERSRIYVLAFATGLRRAEIGSLRKSSFDLTCDPPTLVIEAAYSKHRRRDQLPLHPGLVPQLKEWLRGMQASEFLFPGLAHRKTFKIIKADLKAAGLPYRDSAGKYTDFHSLRHTFITRAWSSGATPDVVRSLARHCDITMTMRYTHTTPVAQAAAMQNMPKLPNVGK